MDIKELLSGVVKKAREEFGEASYKYYAIPVSWRPGKHGGHTRPITGIERFEITKEEWEQNKEESRKQRRAAFVGEHKRGYTDYEERRIVDGWKEKLTALINDFES